MWSSSQTVPTRSLTPSVSKRALGEPMYRCSAVRAKSGFTEFKPITWYNRVLKHMCPLLRKLKRLVLKELKNIYIFSIKLWRISEGLFSWIFIQRESDVGCHGEHSYTRENGQNTFFSCKITQITKLCDMPFWNNAMEYKVLWVKQDKCNVFKQWHWRRIRFSGLLKDSRWLRNRI